VAGAADPHGASGSSVARAADQRGDGGADAPRPRIPRNEYVTFCTASLPEPQVIVPQEDRWWGRWRHHVTGPATGGRDSEPGLHTARNTRKTQRKLENAQKREDLRREDPAAWEAGELERVEQRVTASMVSAQRAQLYADLCRHEEEAGWDASGDRTGWKGGGGKGSGGGCKGRGASCGQKGQEGRGAKGGGKGGDGKRGGGKGGGGKGGGGKGGGGKGGGKGGGGGQMTFCI